MDVTLATRRLTLRQPCMADDAPIARFLDNFAVAGNLARVPYPYRIEHARAWLSTWRPDLMPEETGFIICLAGEGAIGQVGFHLNPRGQTVVGYWLAQPFWNRGFMTEAAAAALGWYFEASTGRVVHSGVFHFNRASLAIQKKLGFVETGMSVMHCLARGEDLRHIDTKLTRAAWAGRRT